MVAGCPRVRRTLRAEDVCGTLALVTARRSRCNERSLNLWDVGVEFHGRNEEISRMEESAGYEFAGAAVPRGAASAFASTSMRPRRSYLLEQRVRPVRQDADMGGIQNRRTSDRGL